MGISGPGHDRRKTVGFLNIKVSDQQSSPLKANVRGQWLMPKHHGSNGVISVCHSPWGLPLGWAYGCLLSSWIPEQPE